MSQYGRYRGRFAPSPTGPLHYGSLVTAVASYLQARSQHGQWFIRIEDIDPDRESKGSIQAILQTLKDYGFQWDHKPILQSKQANLHKHIALELLNSNQAYACSCSRKELAKIAKHGDMGSIYPGSCSKKKLIYQKGTSLRVRVDDSNIEYTDNNFGEQKCNLKKISGDYIIYRANKLPSYILAASIDDLFEQYTEVVRGADLLAITPRQIHLSKLIQNRSPAFLHIPIITHENGDKLSKQTHAPALKKHNARTWLINALTDLGQEPPNNLNWRPIWTIWEWAINHWQQNKIPRLKTLPLKY
ncbi:MAG: tRNA glutamyl-Q(34) synthetase GluQRS [Gammaproteobacteria bacterium]|nr:tRNA glutamyl-Q(34) synthetase GluQRS [Gammaproteobacteria bacterium]